MAPSSNSHALPPHLIISQLPGALASVHAGLLAHNVSVTTTNTLHTALRTRVNCTNRTHVWRNMLKRASHVMQCVLGDITSTLPPFSIRVSVQQCRHDNQNRH